MLSKSSVNFFGLNRLLVFFKPNIFRFREIILSGLEANSIAFFSYSSNEETINSEQPISVRMLPATLLAKVSPETEMIGHPAHKASLEDVCAL